MRSIFNASTNLVVICGALLVLWISATFVPNARHQLPRTAFANHATSPSIDKAIESVIVGLRKINHARLGSVQICYNYWSDRANGNWHRRLLLEVAITPAKEGGTPNAIPAREAIKLQIVESMPHVLRSIAEIGWRECVISVRYTDINQRNSGEEGFFDMPDYKWFWIARHDHINDQVDITSGDTTLYCNHTELAERVAKFDFVLMGAPSKDFFPFTPATIYLEFDEDVIRDDIQGRLANLFSELCPDDGLFSLTVIFLKKDCRWAGWPVISKFSSECAFQVYRLDGTQGNVDNSELIHDVKWAR